MSSDSVLEEASAHEAGLPSLVIRSMIGGVLMGLANLVPGGRIDEDYDKDYDKDVPCLRR